MRVMHAEASLTRAVASACRASIKMPRRHVLDARDYAMMRLMLRASRRIFFF